MAHYWWVRVASTEANPTGSAVITTALHRSPRYLRPVRLDPSPSPFCPHCLPSHHLDPLCLHSRRHPYWLHPRRRLHSHHHHAAIIITTTRGATRCCWSHGATHSLCLQFTDLPRLMLMLSLCADDIHRSTSKWQRLGSVEHCNRVGWQQQEKHK